jgi:hypothetical protein
MRRAYIVVTVSIVGSLCLWAIAQGVRVAYGLFPPRYPQYEALMTAIEHHDVRAAGLELDRGTDPNRYPNDAVSVAAEADVSPLNVACDDDGIEIVRMLLDHRADPNMGDGWYECPLAAAAGANNVDAMRLLITRGARVNDRSGDGGSGSSALWRAAMDGQTAAVRFLLAHGADPNTRFILDGPIPVPLVRALRDVHSGSTEIELLTKAGARG